ncbi:hypothetical protein [Streptosporangium subroseum]|nr:hypothetical protein [Streptosporangium subroseum]
MAIAGKAFGPGGLSLLDLRSMTAISTVPITQLSPAGHSTTRSPIWLPANGKSPQSPAVPDDDSSLLIYSTPPLSRHIPDQPGRSRIDNGCALVMSAPVAERRLVRQDTPHQAREHHVSLKYNMSDSVTYRHF